jgi:hypothetical protein
MELEKTGNLIAGFAFIFSYVAVLILKGYFSYFYSVIASSLIFWMANTLLGLIFLKKHAYLPSNTYCLLNTLLGFAAFFMLVYMKYIYPNMVFSGWLSALGDVVLCGICTRSIMSFPHRELVRSMALRHSERTM